MREGLTPRPLFFSLAMTPKMKIDNSFFFDALEKNISNFCFTDSGQTVNIPEKKQTGATELTNFNTQAKRLSEDKFSCFPKKKEIILLDKIRFY